MTRRRAAARLRRVIALWLLAGTLVLGVLLFDVHETVFVPRGSAGLVTRRLYRGLWWLWSRGLSRLAGPTRRRLLAWLGPWLAPLTVLVWGLLLWGGFALLLAPWGHEFRQNNGPSSLSAWQNILYLSGYSVTTLGVGDVLPPDHGPARVVMLVAAASGFVLTSVAVTYLLAVYGALARMNALAFEIHRFVGRVDGGDPASLVKATLCSDGAGSLSDWLAGTATALSEVVQSEGQYPLLNYFHLPDDLALPMALADLLKVTTLCRSLLDPSAYPTLARGIVPAGTERVARGYFDALHAKFTAPNVDPHELQRLRHASFDRAWQQLSETELPLRSRDEAWERYQSERATWDTACARLRFLFAYPPLDLSPKQAPPDATTKTDTAR